MAGATHSARDRAPKTRDGRRRSILLVAAFGSALTHAGLLLAVMHIEAAKPGAPLIPVFADLQLIELDAEPQTEPSPPPVVAKPLRPALPPGESSPGDPTPRPQPRPSSTPPSPTIATEPPVSLPSGAALALTPREGTGSERGPTGPSGARASLITHDAAFLRGMPTRTPVPEGPALSVPDDPRAGIVELANGNLGYTDPAGFFNAFIKPDGSVTFLDSKNVAVKACVAFVCIGGGEVRPVKAGGKEKHHTMGVDFALVPLGIGGIMGRRVGTNRRETDFLKRTFDMRMQMSLAWQRKQIHRQLRALDEQLQMAWEDPRNASAAAKRELFRQLWRECDADASPVLEALEALPARLLEARKSAAKQARSKIERFYEARAGESLW